MGLDFSTLLQAALGGTAAYQGGRRERSARIAAKARQDELDKQAEELRQSNLEENRAQARSADELALQRQHEREHPEIYHRAPNPPRDPVADHAANRRFDLDNPLPRAPDNHQANRLFDIAHPLPTRDTGEGGSAKDLTDRREFMQTRITHWIDEGLSEGEAQQRAEREYLGAQTSAGARSRTPTSGTAALLAKTIPTPSSSMGPTGATGIRTESAGAGKTGVKPTVTASTPRADPTNANSPKAGTKIAPAGADAKKYATDPAYRAWVDSQRSQ